MYIPDFMKSMKTRKKSLIRRLFVWIRNLVLAFFVLSLFAVILYKYIPVYITPLMLLRTGEQLWKGEDFHLEHQWVPLEKISPALIQAVVASEDNLFLNHKGFDWEQLEKAMAESRKGKRQRGASTISQQTAKNVFLWPSRSYFRKGLEVYFTVLIEWIWGKERIMEVYLNSIEMGKDIYGAERIARINFSKPARQLTSSEAALIAATLPNPLRFSSARPSPYIRQRQAAILDLMKKIGPVKLSP